MPGRVTVSAAALDAMRAHAHRELPRECCGLLAGREDAISQAQPVANALRSEREFFMEPGEMIRALRGFRERGLEHRGIYHSHPASDNSPSPRDIEMAFYPACVYFIISPGKPPERQVRAFRIGDGCVTELEIVIADTNAGRVDLPAAENRRT